MKTMKTMLSVLLAVLLLAACGVLAMAECAHEYDPTYYPPTCNDRGYTEYVCSLCGDRIQEGFVNATGHMYGEWQDLSQPTCTATGLQKRVCRVCQGTETRTIGMLDHADADGDGTCDTCDFVFEKEENNELSPYEWLKLFFRNLVAWFRAIFA
ncbi:MAG: hypothetical protein IJO14_11505 [Clostridia bacterium]|nr:hypothetical protein [Clostridia bacterium]